MAPVALVVVLHARHLLKVLVVPVEELLGQDGRLALDHRCVEGLGLGALERLLLLLVRG